MSNNVCAHCRICFERRAIGKNCQTESPLTATNWALTRTERDELVATRFAGDQRLRSMKVPFIHGASARTKPRQPVRAAAGSLAPCSAFRRVHRGAPLSVGDAAKVDGRGARMR